MGRAGGTEARGKTAAAEVDEDTHPGGTAASFLPTFLRHASMSDCRGLGSMLKSLSLSLPSSMAPIRLWVCSWAGGAGFTVHGGSGGRRWELRAVCCTQSTEHEQRGVGPHFRYPPRSPLEVYKTQKKTRYWSLRAELSACRVSPSYVAIRTR